jgi:hypothetical protein
MRLFGYIAIFGDDVKGDERAIWHHARWGRGDPQYETHARWGRGGLVVAARHCCVPTGGRGGPSPVGHHYPGPTRGRGGSSPTGSPIMVLPKGWGCLIVAVNDKGPDDEGPVPPLVCSLSFFFSKSQEILLTPFSQKCSRFVG